ncbi:MAG: hypothetical protein LBQ50_06620, partial [Planctomycetaceae bacterium]|nr:hypothetical protein [Planctomycetaceae bacterium]
TTPGAPQIGHIKERHDLTAIKNKIKKDQAIQKQICLFHILWGLSKLLKSAKNISFFVKRMYCILCHPFEN